MFQMLQLKTHQSKSSNKLFEQSQKDYIKYLSSLLPSSHLVQQENSSSIYSRNDYDNTSVNDLSFFNKKSLNRFNNSGSWKSLKNSNVSSANSSHAYLNNKDLETFILKIVKTVAKQKNLEEHGQYEPIMKELGVDIKQLNKIDAEDNKIEFMLYSIDKSIQEQKRKLILGYKNGSNFPITQEGCSFSLLPNSSKIKMTNSCSNIQINKKNPSKYKTFIKEQNKKQVDNFAWLQLNTKYPMLQKKLKSKLIQSINEDKNQKRIRDYIQKKANKSKTTNASTFYQNDSEDEKVELVNESLIMEEFQKSKIDYVWTQNDEKMFSKNIKQLKAKCSNNSEFLKLCGRFKFISQGEFQTLACQEISRMLNKNNKIYLSRQFLLDKYFSTTEILTEQQMRFILKTSPMLSKCVDKNFIKNAIKSVKYENISDLELKIAEDIISRFEKLRNTVRDSRKMYKHKTNQVTKQRICRFQKAKQLHIAREIARQELKNHKVHLLRALNYENKRPSSMQKNKNSSKPNTPNNMWTPLNKFHPSTGLFVKDCNQQCTDDLFNPYQKDYLKKVGQKKQPPKRNIANRVQMIKFYTGGPDDSINQNFNETQNDIKTICQAIKAYYFEKQLLSALDSLDIQTSRQVYLTRYQTTKQTLLDIKSKKTVPLPLEDELQLAARKKLMENKQKAKTTVYVSKLLILAAENAFQSLKALDPYFTPEQVNIKDKKGNTALYYAAKFGNQDFIEFLMKFGANPNVQCQKKFTPLHLAFKSNRVSLILKMLTSHLYPPNLNSINSEYKTPLAYSSHQVLKQLNLEGGVASIYPKLESFPFDNNTLLQKEVFDKIRQDTLQLQTSFSRRIVNNKNMNKREDTITSIQEIS